MIDSSGFRFGLWVWVECVGCTVWAFGRLGFEFGVWGSGVLVGGLGCGVYVRDVGAEREFFIDNPLVRSHFIIVMIR